MTELDHNDVRIKPGHTGTSAPPIGQKVWLLQRMDDKLLGAWPTRHDAIGAAATLDGSKEEWFTPIQVPVGSVRLDDVVFINRV